MSGTSYEPFPCRPWPFGQRQVFPGAGRAYSPPARGRGPRQRPLVHPPGGPAGANPLQGLEEANLPNATVDLTASVRAWFTTHPAAERLLLIVDQFEEVLVSEPNARMFLEQVTILMETDLPITAVLGCAMTSTPAW